MAMVLMIVFLLMFEIIMIIEQLFYMARIVFMALF